VAVLAASALGPITTGSLHRQDGIDLLRTPDALEEAIVAGRQRRQPGLDAGYLQLRDVGYRTLPADPPGRMRFRLRVPERATLHFACGVEPATAADPSFVSFVVRARLGAEDETVWRRRIGTPSRPRQAHWVDGAVDLSRFGGRTIDLVLETTSEKPGRVGAAWGAPALAVEDGDAPLVVLYVVDTLRADHTGPYGYDRPTTPELDRFARDGVVFEQAVVHAPWTKPSMASVMTSLLPVQHGASRRPDPLSEPNVTLAESLAGRGWATGAVVGNAILYARRGGFEQGFDYFGGLRDADGRRSRQVRAARAVDAALDWIDSRRGRPTFLYVHTMDPHFPYSPPPPFDEMFAPETGRPRAGRGEATAAQTRESIARYDGEIAYADAQFGRFVRALKDRDLYDHALVVFLSDHGEEFLDHGGLGHGRTLFDELVRVPLVVKMPGGRYAGRRVAQQVQGIDVMPTILRAANIAPPEAAVGRPLQAVIAGGTAPVPALLSTQHWGATALGVRTESEKYIRRFSPKGRQMYFDLDEDEGEREDRAAADPERAREMWEDLEPLVRPAPYRYVLRSGGGSRYALGLTSSGWLEPDPVAAPGVSVEVKDGGHRLRVELDGSEGARGIRVRVRPAGASVRLSGARDGKRLSTREVSVAGVRHPEELPFVLPRPETENPLAAARRLFAQPPDSGPGLWISLVHASPEEALDVDEDTLEALEVLGYAVP